MSELDAQLVGVSKVYDGGVLAVDDVSLDVRRGEFFSMLGPSGCGKSTTLRLMAGLEQLSAGQVLIRGEDMKTRPAHRRPTNMVFQRLALFPHLTAADNVAFGLRLKRTGRAEIRRRVAENLELVGLGDLGRRYPRQLSGGQQQRVAIARALANEPAVLLLDEPLGALDLRLRVQLQEALKRIQAESGTTFVYVTHDQVEALTMSDRIAVMSDGSLEQVGPPADLYSRPRTRFTATFVGDTNLFEGDVDGRLVLRSEGVAFPVPRPGVAASIRPEHVAIEPPDDDDRRRAVLEGVITDVVFQGASVRYRVRLPSGRDVISDQPNDDGAGLEPGRSVRIGWAVERAAMLEE
jgi:spermidine/putrescine transport system ATP-binding protein